MKKRSLVKKSVSKKVRKRKERLVDVYVPRIGMMRVPKRRAEFLRGMGSGGSEFRKKRKK